MPSIASITFVPSAVLGIVMVGDGGFEVKGGSSVQCKATGHSSFVGQKRCS